MQWVLCWRLYLEEFDVTLYYIKGEMNVLADCFLRLPRMSKPSVGYKERLMTKRNKGRLVNFQTLKVPKLTDEINKIMLITNNFHSRWRRLYDSQDNPKLFIRICENDVYKDVYNNWDEPKLFNGICNNDKCEIIECLLNLPSLQEESNPLTMINIYNHQQADADLMRAAPENPEKYINKEINQINVLCLMKTPNKPEMNWKICLSD